jgi:capsular polysaccharide biosynthesis protein
MSNNVDSKAVTASVKIYERLLATYPADFRREYGLAMKQLFRDQCRDAWSQAQARGLAVLWLRVFLDWAKTSLAQHLLNLRNRESMCMKIVRTFRDDTRPRAAFIRVFAVVFLLCVITSALLTIWLPKQYSSMVQIEVQKDEPEAAMAEAHPPILSADPYFLTTQFRVIESYRILTNVIVNLKLNEMLARQNRSPAPWTVDETYEFLAHRLSVEQTRMTSLIEISVRNQSPEMAARIANAVADSYRRFRIEQWMDIQGRISAARDFIQGSSDASDLPAPPMNVIIANPARPGLDSVVPTKSKIFLMWIFAGTLLAALAGGGSAWLARKSSAR